MGARAQHKARFSTAKDHLKNVTDEVDDLIIQSLYSLLKTDFVPWLK